MQEKTTWEQFFDAHAPIYDANVFTKAGDSVLDVGCGTGRHSIELAKRGYSVTGLDLSTEMLAKAATKAKAEYVKVEWVRSDATQFALPKKFDAAICLCEGALGLLSQTDDPISQPLAILRNISRSLKTGAKAVFTVLNAAAVLRRYQNKDVAEGRFDPITMVESSEHPPQEELPRIAVRERSFVPMELRLLIQIAGMSVLSIWGGTAGSWGRRILDLDEIEIMVVARKTGERWTQDTAAKLHVADDILRRQE
jgi:SAM-dependent methyltransferase